MQTVEREALDELSERRRADHEAAIAEQVRERLSAVEGYLNAIHGPQSDVLDVTVERDEAGCWKVHGTPSGGDSWEFIDYLENIERDADQWKAEIESDEWRIRLSRKCGAVAAQSGRMRMPLDCADEAEAAAWLQGYDSAKAEHSA